MEEKLALLHLLSWSEWKHEYKIDAKLFEGFLLLVSFKQNLWTLQKLPFQIDLTMISNLTSRHT